MPNCPYSILLLLQTNCEKVDIFRYKFDILVGDDRKAKMKSVNVNEVWRVGIPCDLGMGANDCYLGAAVYDNGDCLLFIFLT